VIPKTQRGRAGVLCALLVVGGGLAAFLGHRHSASPDAGASGERPLTGVVGARSGIAERERRVGETAWAKELLAQQCGGAVEKLWDALNAGTNWLAVLAGFPMREVVLGRWTSPEPLPHGISRCESEGRGMALTGAAWRQHLEKFKRDGWELDQAEFRHNRFDPGDAGQPRQSVFWFSAHLSNAPLAKRAILAGDLVVDWEAVGAADRAPGVARADASGLTVTTRIGEPFFQPVLARDVAPDERAYFIDPLILHDLDGDGLSEIVLAVQNLVLSRHGPDRYEAQPLCHHPPGPLFTGMIADFDGDAEVDFLCVRWEGMFLFKGSGHRTFEEPGRLAWLAGEPLKNPMAFTCGDIDQDGDLDVFLGQYRVPWLSQNLHPAYYDANDSHPAYLLRNEGGGDFTDVTVAAGLEAKRRRRAFSASFVDLNQDRFQDLVVVSDFAGLDLYKNDGQGRFVDVTRAWVAETRAFGMSHAFADFNADGRLDLLMIGMNSPTVDRLEHLGLVRPDSTEDRSMRRRMAYGNRLYLADPAGGLVQTSLNQSIARTGWSWGSSPLDWDNDGFPDLYIANGHQTKESVREYEPEFWLHDLYIEESADALATTAYFMEKYARTRGQGWSYGGYEKNRLYLNRQGRSFVEIGHLAGVALEEDSRNVVSDDLDGDGRLDLLVTTFEAWPEVKQSVRVYRNTLANGGNWVGFRFPVRTGDLSPIGVRLVLRAPGINASRQVVTGDGFRSQHAPIAHFGLGHCPRVSSVQVHWLDGRQLTLRDPAINRYHEVRPPVAGSAP